MRKWSKRYINTALQSCNSFKYPMYYRHQFDDKQKRKYRKQKLCNDIHLSLAYKYGYKPDYHREEPKFDSFTNESGKLIMCPYTKVIRVNIHDHDDVRIPVPCGKCVYCLHKKQNEWIFRSRNELKYSRSSWFVTLTFDNEHLPKDEKVSKRDIQLFFKRFRKLFKFKVRIKYYCTGEYGSKSGRPHYHLMIFFRDIKPTVSLLKRLILHAWNQGIVDVQPLNLNSVCYVTKYVNKESKHFDSDNYDETTFRQVSKKYGYEWMLYNIESCRSKLTFCYDNYKRNGKIKRYTVPLPRYYKEKVFSKPELYDILLNYLISDSYKDKIDILCNKLDYSKFERIHYLSQHYFDDAEYKYKCRIANEKI